MILLKVAHNLGLVHVVDASLCLVRDYELSNLHAEYYLIV